MPPRPLFLAGGLRADHLAAVIHTMQTHGVDVCSSVRGAGAPDTAKLTTSFGALKAAADTLQQTQP